MRAAAREGPKTGSFSRRKASTSPAASGAYERIIGGEYPRRGGADQRPLSDDYAEAAAHYREHARGAVDQVAAAVKDLSEIVSGAFRNRGGTPPGESPPK